jgi:hypothetical protein
LEVVGRAGEVGARVVDLDRVPGVPGVQAVGRGLTVEELSAAVSQWVIQCVSQCEGVDAIRSVAAAEGVHRRVRRSPHG